MQISLYNNIKIYQPLNIASRQVFAFWKVTGCHARFFSRTPIEFLQETVAFDYVRLQHQNNPDYTVRLKKSRNVTYGVPQGQILEPVFVTKYLLQ